MSRKVVGIVFGRLVFMGVVFVGAVFMAAMPTVGENMQGLTVTSAMAEQLEARVLESYPHDPQAFTQGLLWHGDALYESTGLYGRSSMRQVEPRTGKVLAQEMVDPGLFGEGLTRVGERLIQLTWRAGIALVYDVQNLALVDQWGYEGEGWGLTFDGQRLIMSDGSSRLLFRDPEDFRTLGSIEVKLNGRQLSRLNELEWADGRIYANVWQQDWVVRIDPESGEVDGLADLSNLLTPAERARVDVLNGIAYDPGSKTFWVTGKFWPKIFQVELVAVPRPPAPPPAARQEA